MMTPEEIEQMVKIIPDYLPVPAFQIDEAFCKNARLLMPENPDFRPFIGLWVILYNGQMRLPDRYFRKYFEYAGDEVDLLHQVLMEPSKPKALEGVEVKMYFRTGGEQ